MTAAINPFAVAERGCYSDDVVTVTRSPNAPASSVHTEHFQLWREGDRLHLAHSLPARDIDDDLAGLLAAELFGPGWVDGNETFERLMTGIVLTSSASPLEAWALYYRNTLRRLDELADQPSGAAHGALAGYAPVYQHALELLPRGSVLELGCCFGFLSLQLRVRGDDVIATDVSAPTVALLDRVAPSLGLPLSTLACDASRVPLPDGVVDTVAAIHLLEHLDDDHGAAVALEATRLARQRVVIAVPYEAVANTTYGHVRTVDAGDLAALGAIDGWRASVHDFHGGWLVLDRE